MCQYCGRYGMQGDHVIPRGKGGSDTLSNLVCCCARCNKLVGGRVFKSLQSKKAWVKYTRADGKAKTRRKRV